MASAVSTKKKKRQALSIETKMDILRDVVERRLKKIEVARKYEIPPSTLSTILLNRKQITKQYETSNTEPSRKRLRGAELEDVEKAVFRWFSDMRAKNLPVSGPLMREKAEYLAKKLGHDKFQASSGWLSRFKERHGIQQLRVCGESAGVDENVVDTWKKESLPAIIAQYSPRDIFNADETGLFYRLTPDKSLAFSGQECHGMKQNKERVTVMVCANMDGSEKIKPLVIGKSKQPRSLKHVRTLPLDYRANRKAWMTTEEFVSWVKRLDAKFAAENRQVLVFVDNCSAHPSVNGLKSIQLQFFPPNTTSKLQPMDQGVIMSFKTYYRKRLVKHLLKSYEAGEVPSPVSIKDAIDMTYAAWEEVTASCISNCFQKAGFEVHENANPDTPGPSGRPDNIWERLRQNPDPQNDGNDVAGSACDEADDLWKRLRHHMTISRSISFNDFAAADNEISGVYAPTDEELVREIQKQRGGEFVEEEDDDDLDVDMPPAPPSVTEVLGHLERVKDFLYSREEAQDQHFHALSTLNELAKRCQERSLVQQKITRFFKA
ncbi:tigger transposable element-derived protein 6-like [Diadema setosum]|uniref:tigger transposable element-derived protein 6-like n=1 Tax=Diadema setosum TaxID=31175 RepID=UPI003B3BCC06